MPSLRASVQRTLERGLLRDAPGTALLARGWGRWAQVERPLAARVPVLCVGGATLGGSGKTPLALACARALAEHGRRVTLVSHAYRASPPASPRRVAPDDDPAVVGDEALECARALGSTVTVLVARRREDAVEAAAAADVLVLDGPLQLAPRRATLSLLAVDADDPWGSGACPPAGDLRAPRQALVAAADLVVPVRGTSRGAFVSGALVPFEALQTIDVGLATGIARPSRVLRLLAAHGVRPRVVLEHADHARLRLRRRSGLLWLVTAKDAAREARTDLGVLDYHLDLPPSLRKELLDRFPFRF